MEFGSIIILVKDPDAALKTYLKLFGTNNVEQVIKLKGLSDTVDTIDGYYLKTKPVNLGIYKPRISTGRMGEYLEKYGEGIHHIELHLGQDEFEETYIRFKSDGLPVSERVIYLGKFSEAIFWLEETGEQGLPIKFSTTTYRGLKMWEDTIYLDTPQRFEKVSITEEYQRPKIALKSIMVTVNEWEKQQRIWSGILSRPAVHIGDIFTNEEAEVNDGRGNIFVPVRYEFPGGGGINLYCALNEDAPINKVMAARGRHTMYHNAAGYIARDKVHECWKQWEEAGFAMVDPKPLLNSVTGNGNYFFFVHPISSHGVLWEWVSMTTRDEATRACFDWSNVETYMVAPDIR
ncbi:hypothetical protein ACFLZG_03620 [Thermodesulfobacteriota bacterium]